MMTLKVLKAAVLSLAMIPLVSCGTVRRAESPTEFVSAPLFGMVYDLDGSPVQGVKIELDGASCAESDVNGRFVVPEVSKGDHTFTAALERYEPVSMPFQFLNRSQVLYLKIVSLEQLLAAAEKSLETGGLDEADRLLSRAEKVAVHLYPVLSYLQAVLLWKKGDAPGASAILEAMVASGYGGSEVRNFLGGMKESSR